MKRASIPGGKYSMKTVIQDLSANETALITWSLNMRKVHIENALNEEKLPK